MSFTGGRDKASGKFVYRVYGADNVLFATIEGDDFAETEARAYEVQREALAPILGGHKMTAAEWADPLLDMSDDELLAALK